MILLPVGSALEVLLGGAITTSELQFVGCYVELSATDKVYEPKLEHGLTSGATAVQAIASPVSGRTHQVKSFNVWNADTVDATVTVRVNRNGTLRTLVSVTLSSGQSLAFVEGAGWQTFDGAPVAAAAAAPVEQTTSLTGTQNNFDLDSSFTYLRCTNTAALLLTGFTVNGAAPSEGDRVIIDNLGSSTVRVDNENTGSTAANRARSVSARGQIIGGDGRMEAVYDATTSRWRLACVEPGDWIEVPHNSGDFDGNDAMTWTVGASDLVTFAYKQNGDQVYVMLAIESSSVGGTPSGSLQVVNFPGGFTPTDVGGTTVYGVTYGQDNGSNEAIRIAAITGGIGFNRIDGPTWTLSSNNTRVYANQVFRVA